MHLERVLIVVEQRIRPDGTYPGFDIRHMEGPLECSGIVENIDVFYYNDYTPNSDDALLNYCLEKKPQAVLLSLQNIGMQGSCLGRGPTPDAIREITHQLRIGTVAFWFDIHSDRTAGILERYLHSVVLNVFLGADASSHKVLPLQNTNYAYAGLTFDERLFSRTDGPRDIPVGFLGSQWCGRSQWISSLAETGIPVCTSSGTIVGGRRSFLASDNVPRVWITYEEYLEFMSRLRIALNFSYLHGGAPFRWGLSSINRERHWETAFWLALQARGWLRAVAKNPAKVKLVVPILKVSRGYMASKPRYMVRARVWEALWCRTFLLEQDNPVTRKYFQPYVDYVPFTKLKDLVDKIRYYLENEEERDRIRIQGRATVEKYYGARIYWENLFETIGLGSGRRKHYHSGELWNKAYFHNLYLKDNTQKDG